MAIPKWSRRTGWVALLVAAGCALALAFLVTSSAIEMGKGPWVALFLFVLGALAAFTALFATESAPWDARHWTAWLKPRPIAFIFLAIFAGFGTMTNALALFEPRPAVESAPGAIETTVNAIETTAKEIREAVRPKAQEPPRIARKLPGVWGEPGCAVTYRFGVTGEALTIETVLRPPNTSPWRGVATIVSKDGDVMQVRMEQPDRGAAVTFTYLTNGVTERLRWHDQSRPVPLDLDRCEETR